ncbi:hypothetical protein SAY86_030439 [Trapa natans]|uniref:BHLH domain-containing protein n=1 Tax=Trapa natans TaxID=22666 RepID=A0AAN7MRS5_TRANT|nr:hypothetical protein SAY86_030439 [Trapa natans]
MIKLSLNSLKSNSNPVGPNPNTAKITPKKIKEREKSPWPWRLSASSKTPYSHPLTTPPTRSAALPLPSGLGSKPDYYDDTMADATAAAGVVETEDATVPENDVAGVAELDGGFNNSSTSSENFWGCPVAAERRKRRRPRVVKNKEEVESQRMTHIVVERNRRKQMNEYLSMLRSMMPPSYVHRGDQASIIGGAVNFVKELEQLLQSLKAVSQRGPRAVPDNLSSSPFADFFTFPQYSTDPTHPTRYGGLSADPMAAGRVAAAADVEVNMVDAHANVKVLSRRKPQQLLKMVVGLQSLGLTILHLNVTSVHDTALFSFSIKVEDECQLTSVNEMATEVYEMINKLQGRGAVEDKAWERDETAPKKETPSEVDVAAASSQKCYRNQSSGGAGSLQLHLMDNFSDAPSLSGCSRHPILRQLPGVCPSCLRERLQRLITSPEARAGTHPSWRLYLRSPSWSSSGHEYGSFRGSSRRERDGSAMAEEKRLLLLASTVRGSLRKSQSAAAAAAAETRSNEDEKMKRGFWSKLIMFRWSHHNYHD